MFAGRDDDAATEDDMSMSDSTLAAEAGTCVGYPRASAPAGEDNEWAWSIRGPPRSQ
jgi:hypothetical protein